MVRSHCRYFLGLGIGMGSVRIKSMFLFMASRSSFATSDLIPSRLFSSGNRGRAPQARVSTKPFSRLLFL